MILEGASWGYVASRIQVIRRRDYRNENDYFSVNSNCTRSFLDLDRRSRCLNAFIGFGLVFLRVGRFFVIYEGDEYMSRRHNF